MMPEVLDDGSVKIDGNYEVFKIGQRCEQRVRNGKNYAYKGSLETTIKKDKPMYVGFRFRTSWIQGIYIHGIKEFDELLHPMLGIYDDLNDLPKAKDLDTPELKEGDMVLATDNSFYCLTASRLIGKAAGKVRTEPGCSE